MQMREMTVSTRAWAIMMVAAIMAAVVVAAAIMKSQRFGEGICLRVRGEMASKTTVGFSQGQSHIFSNK